MTTKDTFSTAEAAAILNIEFETLRFWDKTHCLPMIGLKESGKWRRLDFVDLVRLALMARLVESHLPPFEAGFVTLGLTSGIGLDITPIRFLAVGRFECTGRHFFRCRLIADSMSGEWMINPAVWGAQGIVSFIEFDSDDPSHQLMQSVRRGDKPAIAAFPPGSDESAPTLSPYSVLLLDITTTRERVREGIDRAVHNAFPERPAETE